jgi:hypothetical protein
MVFLLLGALPVKAQGPLRILADQARDHIGQQAQVCGVVASTRYARSSNGAPTYLNFDKPYPDNDFTVVVWGRDRKHFPNPPELLLHHKACVSGRIERYRGKPQIIASGPDQIVFWPLEEKRAQQN